jgi:outer membrane protein assembly factor BamB
MRKLLATLLVFLTWSANLPAENWSHWRGPEQNGVSRDRDMPEKFNATNPKAENSNVIWKVPYGGRSTPIIQNGRVYIINKDGEGLHEQERVMCFDEKDGKVLWEYKFNVWHTDIVSVRLGWTNMVGDPETGNVYAHGTQGLLFCFDKDGKVLWQHSLTEEYGRISGYGGRVTSPIVDGDLLLISMLNASWGYQGMGRTRFVAFDKKTGKVMWWASAGFPPKDTYYSTPVVANIGGQRLLISGGGDGGVHAFKVRTGEKVWSYIFGTSAVNCSPVVDGDRVYIGHGEENDGVIEQGRVICVDGSQVTKGEPKLIWKVDGIKAKFASPIILDGLLYICDEIGRLYCLDAKDGKVLWEHRYGRNSKGSPVWAEGKIYIPEVNSKFHILKVDRMGCEPLSAQFFRKAAGGTDVEINGSPAIANGRVYFMTSNEMLCIGKPGHNAKADVIPKGPSEAPRANPAKPAQLQIVPADVVLYPGDSVALTVRSFDSTGQLIGEAKADWELAPMRSPEGLPPPPKGAPPPPAPPTLQGELSEKSGPATKLTAAKMPPVQFGGVVAKMGDLTAECRVRVVARLPYTANFAPVPPGRTPAGWVNCQGKFAVQEEGGKKLLKKLNLNASPLVARANAYIGLPDLKDYTIEADVMGTQVGPDMPDLGIVCQRYTLMLAGNQQKLRLVSWEALPRVDNSIAFPWTPKTWYRLKFTVEIKNGKGLIKGKAWPRDKEEPKEWTVEFTDPIPNTEGAPAVYGYSTNILPGQPGNEIFYDNVKITPNK